MQGMQLTDTPTGGPTGAPQAESSYYGQREWTCPGLCCEGFILGGKYRALQSSHDPWMRDEHSPREWRKIN